MLRNKSQKVGLDLSTLYCCVDEQFLNNHSAVGIKSEEKIFEKGHGQNYYFQLKKLWLLLIVIFPPYHIY